MTEFRGTVEKTDLKLTTGGNKYVVLKLKEAQSTFSSFNPEEFKDINLNDEISFSYTEKDKYKNIDSGSVTIIKKSKIQSQPQKQDKDKIHLTDENIRLKSLEIASVYEKDNIIRAMELSKRIEKYARTGVYPI